MKLNINLAHTSYDILIEKDCIQNVSRYVNLKRNIFIVMDKGVPTQYLETLLKQCEHANYIVVEQGEGSKSFEVYELILKKLLELKFTRTDLLIALGGGVIGDLCGFVASSYMRGIDFISIPTTSLSQIDSSIGGKVAINLDHVKNIVGAFYHPKMVFIDTNLLKTLPNRQLMNGLVEALKAGLIYDETLFNLFEKDNYLDYLDEIITRSLAVKKDVVEKDEKEQHLRKILNFGHTLGHAIESYYGLSELYHGECVAIGMLGMLEDEALKNRVLKIYEKMGLKTKVDFDLEAIYQLMLKDKKATKNNITIVTVKKCGQAELKEIEFEALKTYINKI